MPRVLICEDSGTFAAGLRRVLEYDGDITVAATCGTAEEAIAALPRVRPDLVTMDIELPGMDGLAATEEIMGSRPVPVLVLSARLGHGNHKAVAALAAGAVDAVEKDALDPRDPAGVTAAAFRQRVRTLSRARVIRHPRARLRDKRTMTVRAARVVGICGSTGAPQVLARLLSSLPADYPVPLLIVQHISPGFTESLAGWLNGLAALPVAIATDGTAAGSGVWIAPEGAHLKLAATGRLHLDTRTAAGRHRPSGDVLFESISTAAGALAVAVVLTGMGSDGAAGAMEVRRRGGLVIAQDEETSAIFGMPKATIDGGADLVLGPDEIAACLRYLRQEQLPWPL
jgi:two-component system, chemotaxis family, protein-glutamate methylesterase/glutaminase